MNFVSPSTLLCPMADSPISVSADPGRDWPEDFSHENGKYLRVCIFCEGPFTGHKRRVCCKKCASVPADGPEQDSCINGHWTAIPEVGPQTVFASPSLLGAPDSAKAALPEMKAIRARENSGCTNCEHPVADHCGVTSNGCSCCDGPASVENSEPRITPEEALVCWRALDRVPELEAVERHPAFLSVHAKMEAWARGASRDGTFHCPQCGRDTPHMHPIGNSELRDALRDYRQAVIAADHCYGEGNESELLGAEAGAQVQVEELFASLKVLYRVLIFRYVNLSQEHQEAKREISRLREGTSND